MPESVDCELEVELRSLWCKTHLEQFKDVAGTLTTAFIDVATLIAAYHFGSRDAHHVNQVLSEIKPVCCFIGAPILADSRERWHVVAERLTHTTETATNGDTAVTKTV